MRSRLALALLVTVTLGGGAAVIACSSDEASSSSDTPDASSSSGSSGKTSSSSSSSSSSGSSSGDTDAAVDDAGKDAGGDGSCSPAPPVLDGGEGCGTGTFGMAAAPFGPVDGGNAYAGGAFEPGIYDALYGERASNAGGSWRETFVVDGTGRFTRIRQIDTGSGAGPGPISRRSGTVVPNGTNATFTYDCAFTNDAGVDAGPDTLPFEVVKDGCNVFYRYGASGIRITLKRR